MGNTEKLPEKMNESDDCDKKFPEKKRRFIEYLWPLPVDLVVFLTFFANSISNILYQNLVIKLTCTTIYNYDPIVCNQLGTQNATAEVKTIEKFVQPYAANVMMTKMIVDNVIPAIIGLFLGAWSDKFGRKPVLLLCVIGFLLQAITATTIAGFTSYYLISPWFFIIPSIPSALGGGICNLLGSSYSYIADTTTIENRSIRIAAVAFSTAMGIFCGFISSGPIVETVAPEIAFGISSIILTVCLVYVSFVPESLSSENMQKTSKIRGFFQWQTIEEMLKAFFKKRNNYDRMIMWMCMAVLSGYIFAIEGPIQIFYLYVRDKFSFTTSDYTTYNAAFIITLILDSVTFLVLFQKYLKLSMPVIILFGLASGIVDSIIKATSSVVWLLYLNLVITGGKGVSLHICRSLISQVVPANEIGKIYSLSTALEFISPLISAPIYTAVYNATLNTFSEAFHLVSLAVYILCFIMITILYIMDKRYSMIKIQIKE